MDTHLISWILVLLEWWFFFLDQKESCWQFTCRTIVQVHLLIRVNNFIQNSFLFEWIFHIVLLLKIMPYNSEVTPGPQLITPLLSQSAKTFHTFSCHLKELHGWIKNHIKTTSPKSFVWNISPFEKWIKYWPTICWPISNQKKIKIRLEPFGAMPSNLN